MKHLVGRGIFGWDSSERRTNRYGAIHLSNGPYSGPDRAEVFHNREALGRAFGMKVRLTVKVVESRKSTHVGDQALKISPSQPSVGEEIDLGVGDLDLEQGYDGTPDIVLQPGDRRKELWIDPRKLYRLHDQTVEVFIEETSEPYSPKPDISVSS